MAGMGTVLEELQRVAPAVLDTEPVAFAYLFGSHAGGTAGPRSDIDVAVHLDGSADVDPLALRLRLAGRLEGALGRGPVDVVVLDEAPLALAGRVRRHGRPVYSRDEVSRVRYESLTARRYHDFHIHEERMAREALARMSEGR